MKLRNKLIPLLSVVATTGVVAPIASSCGFAKLSDDGLVDVNTNYTPTIAKAKKVTTEMTAEDAQDLYFEHLAQNPEILAQDVYKYQADYLPTRIEYIEYYQENGGKSTQQNFIAKNVTARVGVSNISFKKVKYVETEGTEKVEKSFYAVSCDLKYHFTFSALSIDGVYELDADLNMEASMHDIPTQVYSVTKFNPDWVGQPHAYTKVWRVSNVFTDSKLLDAVPGWSYTINRNDTITQTAIDQFGKKISSTQSTNRNGTISRKDQIADLMKNPAEDIKSYYDEFLSFDSYHLSDVAANKEDVGMELALNEDGAIEAQVKSKTQADVIQYNLKKFNLFNNVSKELAEKIDSNDYKINIYFGQEDFYLPTKASEIGGTTNTLGAVQSDETHQITYKNNGVATSIDASYENRVDLSNNYYGYSQYAYDDTNKTITTSDYTYLNITPNQDDPVYITQQITDIKEWSEQDTFTNFYAIPAGTYIGYACAKYNEDGTLDPDTFECKVCEIEKEIPLYITVDAQ